MTNSTTTSAKEEPIRTDSTPDAGETAAGTDNITEEKDTDAQETDQENDQEEKADISTTDHSHDHTDEEVRPNLSMRDFLGGDILARGWIRRQMGIIVLLVVLTIIYITNRYSAEQELIEIENLKEQYQEIKYRALTRSSELTERSRQSQLENMMRHTADSLLAAPKEPPFKLLKPAEE